LAQPINVGIGKPFKDHVRAKWWEWLDETNITQETVQNSWRKTGFSYFPEVDGGIL